MARRIIDISVALKSGIASDPPRSLPEIEYLDHKMTAPGMAQEFGIREDQLPEGNYAAVERVKLSTHNGTHLDAPYHFFPRMNERSVPGGEPSWRIELGSGQGIPFKYYQGTKFRFGFTPEIFQAEIGGELVWEGEASPQSMLGWYGLLGGGGYGTFYTWDDQGRVELSWYLTLGGGARLYLHRASGLCLTLGSELQFNFGARERLSLTAALSIPSF